MAVAPAPKGTKIVTFVCRRQRVFHFDTDTLNNALARGLLASSRGKGEDANVFDFAAHFLDNDIGDECMRIKLIPARDARGRTCIVRMVPRPEAGEDLTKALMGKSKYEKVLRSLDPGKTCLVFDVWSDSFGAYLLARRLADSAGFACGWEPFSEDHFLQFRLFRSGSKGTRPYIDEKRK